MFVRVTIIIAALFTLVAFMAPGIAGTFKEETGFGDNPGHLRMFTYVPDDFPRDRPLVVVMHGCSQSAHSIYGTTGWAALADASGFALLLPQEPTSPNPVNCLNGITPANPYSRSGEPASIVAMIAKMAHTYRVNPKQFYIVGLSTGAALSAVLLATYPEVFAGGALLAGPPYPCAAGLTDTNRCLSPGSANRTPSEWGDAVRRATSYHGPWPRVSLWNGSADTVVSPQNLIANRTQWLNVHGLPETPTHHETITGTEPNPRTAQPYTAEHAVWMHDGQAVVETWLVNDIGHGVPIDAHGGCGVNLTDDRMLATDPYYNDYVLDVGLCAVRRITNFWGLRQ